jgi:phosphatidylinositol glycan class B
MFSSKRNLLFLLIPAIYLLTALNSAGYHHPDEHYQIIEFAGLKGDWAAASILQSEFDSANTQ